MSGAPTSTDPTATTTATTTPPADGLVTGKSDATTALGAGLSQTVPPVDKPAEPTGAPEAYTDWKLPDGYTLDTGVSEAGTKIFKDLNLTQDQAQKLVDFYSEHAIKSSKETLDAWQATRKEWRDSIVADPALGKLTGSNGNFGPDSALVVTVNRALDGLQNPKLVSDFKDAMELTGAGDNPAFVKVLYALASKVTEGTTYARGEPSKTANARPTAGAALYPNLPAS
jgi:hypothetical protein